MNPQIEKASTYHPPEDGQSAKETATFKDRQTALAFAYQIVTDKRNSGRYDMTQFRNFDTNECFGYFDMLRVLRVMHAEVVEAQKANAEVEG